MNEIRVVDAWQRVIMCMARLNGLLEERRQNLEALVDNGENISVNKYDLYVRDCMQQRKLNDIMRMIHNIGNRVTADEATMRVPDGMAPPNSPMETIDSAIDHCRKVLFALNSLDSRRETSTAAFVADMNTLIMALEGLKPYQWVDNPL